MRVLHFLRPLGPPVGTELRSCHLTDTNNFEKDPKFLKSGLRHPVPYVHVYNATQMIRSTEGCRWVFTKHRRVQMSFMFTRQENTSGNDNSNPNQQWEHQKRKHNYYCIAASLRHDQTFHKVSQISITCSQSVCSHIYTACQAHVPYNITICGLSGSIFPHCFTKQHNFQTHVMKHKMCGFSLQKEVFHETNSCF